MSGRTWLPATAVRLLSTGLDADSQDNRGRKHVRSCLEARCATQPYVGRYCFQANAAKNKEMQIDSLTFNCDAHKKAAEEVWKTCSHLARPPPRLSSHVGHLCVRISPWRWE
ncbi:hypothetical protein GGR53DRAFT_283450 [Hypoxylon sp. FL1150]|nr:hypothetical protein GGR53DRAFT_283450 [Hypoxylon sp. FL1150]